MEITIAAVLFYISNYMLAFVISLLGAFTNEMMAAMRTKNKISIFRILAPGIFDAFLLLALQSHFNLNFPMYAFLCYMCGMWGLQLIETVTNKKFVFAFLKALLKNFSSELAKATDDALEKTIPEEKKEKKTVQKKDKETTQKK